MFIMDDYIKIKNRFLQAYFIALFRFFPAGDRLNDFRRSSLNPGRTRSLYSLTKIDFLAISFGESEEESICGGDFFHERMSINRALKLNYNCGGVDFRGPYGDR